MLRHFELYISSLFFSLLFLFCFIGNTQGGVSPWIVMTKKKQMSHTWKAYATFDEFKLKGIGTPGDSSVFVKDCGDSVLVRKSSCNDSVIVYRKNGANWENHLFLDFEKDNLDYLDESSFDLPPRIYDRYLINDTIIEICSFFFPDKMSIWVDLIIKPSTYDKVYHINFEYKNTGFYRESLQFFFYNPSILCNIRLLDYFKKDPRRALKILNNTHSLEPDIKTKITEFLVSEDVDYVYYSDATDTDEGLIAKKSHFGRFGLQPGFDCFYNRLWTPWDMGEDEEELIEHVHPPSDYQGK